MRYVYDYADIASSIEIILIEKQTAFIEEHIIGSHKDAKIIAEDLNLHCKFDSVKHLYIFSEAMFRKSTEHVLC